MRVQLPRTSLDSALRAVVDDRPNRPQRVIRRHPRFQIDVAEQSARTPIPASHPPSPHRGGPLRQTPTTIAPPCATFFNSLLV